MADISVGDIGVTIDMELGEDVSDLTSAEIIITHESSENTKTFTAALNGTTGIRYTTASAADIPRAGLWKIQAHVVQPGLDRISSVQTFSVEEDIS